MSALKAQTGWSVQSSAKRLLIDAREALLFYRYCGEHGSCDRASFAQIIAIGGFDAWNILHSTDSGFTWPLHCEDPFTPSTTTDQRLDLVLIRNGQRGLDALTTDLIGVTPSDLTPSGLWPSDHAGLTSVFRLEP